MPSRDRRRTVFLDMVGVTMNRQNFLRLYAVLSSIQSVYYSHAQLERMGKKTMAAIDDLKAAVANDDTASDAAVAYIGTLGAELQAALDNGDTAALQQITTDVAAHAAELQAAVPAPSSAPVSTPVANPANPDPTVTG